LYIFTVGHDNPWGGSNLITISFSMVHIYQLEI